MEPPNPWEEVALTCSCSLELAKYQANPEPRELLPSHSRPPSWVSPSLPSEDSLEEVVSRESPLSSMTRPYSSSDLSSRTLSETPSPTLNTPRGRLSPPSMSSMLSRDKAEPSTVSAADQLVHLLIVGFTTNTSY